MNYSELLQLAKGWGNFVSDRINIWRLPLNYDKYFKDGDADRNTLTEFNSNNTRLLNKEEIKAKMMELKYIQERLAEE